MTTHAFITGMARSGTTLLDKVLSNHPEATILSQPFPLLFIGAKRAFLAGRSIAPEIYPLNSLFLEDRYSFNDFSEFLSSFRFSPGQLSALFGEMISYPGQYTRTPGVDSALPGLYQLPFADLIASLQLRFRLREAAIVYGSKETYCEEFLPYLAAAGWKCILIIRDPRDTIVSLNFGDFERYSGKRRPILWDLRQWRKSVAFALMLGKHPAVKVIRYEDLVTRPEPLLNELTDFLGLARFQENILSRGLLDQSGINWSGNSSHLGGQVRSHGSFSTDSVNRYQLSLPPELITYIETVCSPEMAAIGYEPTHDFSIDTVTRYSEPFAEERNGFSSYYGSPKERAAEEVRRLNIILSKETIDNVSAGTYFISYEAFNALRNSGARRCPA